MSNNNERVVLAPDSACFDASAPAEVRREQGPDGCTLYGPRTLTEDEARHLRDWLCEQFGPPPLPIVPTRGPFVRIEDDE